MTNHTGIGSFINGAAGSAQGREGTTVETFAASLAAGFVLFGVQFGIFLLLRNYLWAKRIFQPRSFLIPLKDRVKPPPANPLRWLWTVYKIKEDTEILSKAGMDAYFFLRYLSMCLKMFFCMAILILPILLPLNRSHGVGKRVIGEHQYNVTGLDTVAWSNVSPENTDRYWAHLVLAIGVVAWACYLFHHELKHYVKTRQNYLGSPSHRLKASSTTVLITNIPKDICSPEALTEMYDDFPGGVRRIWMNRDYTKLVNKDKERKKFEDLLENAETNMIRSAIKRHHKMQRKGETTSNSSVNGVEDHAPVLPALDLAFTPDEQRRRHTLNGEIAEPASPAACEGDLKHDLDTKAAWTQYIAPKNRKKMRIPKPNYTAAFKIPLIGRFFSDKVDTIYYCRRELARLNKEIESDIESPDSYPLSWSAFIQFNTQKAAHLACQSVADTQPRRMTKRIVEISPGDIHWENLNIRWKQRYLRLVSFLSLFILLIIAFGIISFFTGILSQASTLAGATSWLQWIHKLPKWAISFIQGTLPPVILVILLSGPLPILLRALTNNTRGAPTGSQGERSLQVWYLVFLIFELFIIPTISSGITSTVTDLVQNPGNTINILAKNLPSASNYYFSFLVVQALSISASSILQTIRLFNFYVIGGVNTPDAVFNKLSWTNRTRIGSNIPWYTTFAIIGLVYSVVAPLILLFMILTFTLFWFVIKNNILYCVRTGNVDGGGLFFPNAITQLFTGLYFMELCLLGLFFLVRDLDNKVACQAQGTIMAVVLGLTILYQVWLTVNFNGLLKYAPVRLEGDAARRDKEYELERLTTTAPSSIPDGTPIDNEKLTAGLSRDTDEPTLDRVNTEASQYSRLRLEKRRSSSLHPRLNTGAAAARSKDMQAQQRRDGQHAKSILARLNRPLDDHRLAELETNLLRAEVRVGNVLVPRQKDIEAQMMNDPISRIIMQHNDELEDLDPEERDMLISVAFTHPVLRETRPSVWIPSDDLGVSDDEVRRTVAFSGDITIDNRGAYFDKKLKVQVNKPPPDMSEFALVMAEL